ncbi:unnamed protein product, partial [Phaeothamnion confervicola]
KPTTRLAPGTVLAASPEEYGHFTMKATLIFEHGIAGSKAVCLDRGSPFEIGEMTSTDLGPLAKNRLYRGGEDGGATAFVLHPYQLEGAVPIGESGLYMGGLAAAAAAVNNGTAPPEDFKFAFGYIKWGPGTLEEQVQKGKWMLVELPQDMILGQKANRDM